MSNQRFRAYYIEAILNAIELSVGVKDSGYNRGGVEIRDYWQYRGPRDIAYMCHAKALRAISVTDNTNNEAQNLTESVKDTAVDLINYAAFMYAEEVLRQEESKWKQSNQKSPSSAGPLSPLKLSLGSAKSTHKLALILLTRLENLVLILKKRLLSS
ncbi:MAG TPA: hypothetical protein VIH30_09565 [Aquirhabdus sp.]